MPSAGGKKVFIDGIDVVEVQAAQAATNAALTTTLNTVLQRVMVLEANQALVNDTALEARLSDLEVDASLPSLPSTPANWSIALFFEGYHGQKADLARDSSAGALSSVNVVYPGLVHEYIAGCGICISATSLLIQQGYRIPIPAYVSPRLGGYLDSSDARTLSTSSLHINTGGVIQYPPPTLGSFWARRTLS